MVEEGFTFGDFRLIPAQRILLREGTPLHLSGRALDILIALVESAGETIPKERLIAHAWPDTVVGEGALRVHVAALRKALGDSRAGTRYVVNVPGRGYSFVAPLARQQRHPDRARPDMPAAPVNLPMPLTRIIGREDVIATLSARLAERRLLTIIGPGGIGKTTVAIAVAEALLASFSSGISFVQLDSLADSNLVPSTISAGFRISLTGVDPLTGLKAWLRDKDALIVLDGCEHVVGAAASIAEELLRAAPRVRVLATSREPLRAEAEWLHRLTSLEVPPNSAALTTGDALQYSAVELFIERASASVEGLAIGAADLPAVIEICQRLDGVPLALELAAAQVGVLGIRGLAARLHDRFVLLTKGRRTALARHQTLRAAMDWSYDLLPEREQLILKRLSVFLGDFTMEAAAAVAADDQMASADVSDGVCTLALKSLVAADIGRNPAFYRLLDTTRLYGLEKLTETGDLGRLRRRHAEFYCALFERAESELQTRTSDEWLALYGRRIGNVRAALDWAFSPGADPSLGAALTAASVPLWVQLSLLNECRERLERAISVASAESAPDARREMKLWTALGLCFAQTKSANVVTSGAWTKVLALAERLGDSEFQLRALWGLANYNAAIGKNRAALAFAERFCSLAAKRPDPTDLLIGHRMMGRWMHDLGKHAEARRHVEHMLSRYVTPERHSHIVRFQFDQEVMAYVSLARILWAQGFPEQALRAARTSFEKANAVGHALTTCAALTDAACPIALLNGDLAVAERNAAALLDHSARHGLATWHAWGRGFEGALLIRRGNLTPGLRLLCTAREELREAGFSQRNRTLFVSLAEAFARAGQAAEGLTTINEALSRCEDDDDGYMPEQLRIKGELLRFDGAPSLVASEDHFRHALDLARRQGALSWELRAATSLARLIRDQRRAAEARDFLAAVYGRFSEGFATEDLQAAKTMLEQFA